MSAIMSISLVFISIRVGEYSIAILGIALMGSCFGFCRLTLIQQNIYG